MTFDQILVEVKAERQRQDKQWGGYAHDSGHSKNDWIALIAKHAGKAAFCPEEDDEGWTQRMVVVAALASAAIEAQG